MVGHFNREIRWCHFVAGLVMCLGLASCSSVMDLDCQPQNWHAQGLKDGAHGAPPTAADEYKRACDQQSKAFDRQAYEEGRQEGLAVYCTGKNGLDLGLNGQGVAKVCPTEMAQLFRDSYLAGRTLRRSVRNLEHAVTHGEPSFTGAAIAQARYYRISQELANNNGTDDRSQELRSMKSELTSQVSNGQPVYATDSRRILNLILRCEKAKQRVGAMGFYADVKCN